MIAVIYIAGTLVVTKGNAYILPYGTAPTDKDFDTTAIDITSLLNP